MAYGERDGVYIGHVLLAVNGQQLTGDSLPDGKNVLEVILIFNERKIKSLYTRFIFLKIVKLLYYLLCLAPLMSLWLLYLHGIFYAQHKFLTFYWYPVWPSLTFWTNFYMPLFREIIEFYFFYQIRSLRIIFGRCIEKLNIYLCQQQGVFVSYFVNPALIFYRILSFYVFKYQERILRCFVRNVSYAYT